jgi:HEXXH motif-containing protein
MVVTESEFAVADPPLDAVPTYGAGQAEVDRLSNAFALQWILRLFSLRSTLASVGVDPARRGRFGALGEWFVGLSAEEARTRLQNPAFAAWLVRMWNVASGNAGPTDERQRQAFLEHEIDLLPILLLRDLNRLEALDTSAVPCRLPTDARIAPLGLGWRLVARSDIGEPVHLRRVRGGIEIVAGGEVLSYVPLSELAPGAPGTSVRIRSEAIVIEPRTFILDGRIEILPYSAFPELSARRLPQELPCGLDDQVLDRELRRAFELLRTVWPQSLPDVDAFFRGLLPIEMPAANWNSASTGELPFVLQLTVREDAWPFLLADSILHETAHTKLDMAMLFTPLLLNDDQKIYQHPWRPDPRPMAGVLLGAHAFLSVMKLYERALLVWPRDDAIREQYQRRRDEVSTAMATLAGAARFTPAGERIYKKMLEAFEEHPTS